MEEEIYAAALEHYGEASQVDKLIEEMAELTQALLKVRRLGAGPGGFTRRAHLHEEFVDVEIVMAQLRTTLDLDLLQSYRKVKLDRLVAHIEKGENDVNKYQKS